MSSHMLLASEALEEVVTVEIEPEMIRGSRAFYPANDRVFDDPRSSIVIEDARTYFAAAEEEFDLILSEPSNPWVSGVASLFTTEFYQHIRRYLADDGVFGQWIQLYEIDDALILSIIAALHENFSSYEMFLVDVTDLLIVASESEIMPEADWGVARLPALVEDLCNIVPLTPEALEGTRVSHRAALAPLLDDWGQGNSDFYPAVDLLAERTRYLALTATGFTQLALDRFDMTAPFFNRPQPLALEMLVSIPDIDPVRARALSATLRALRDGGEPPPDGVPVDFRGAIHRWEQWLSSLEANRAPSDWRLWTARALDMEVDIGRGTAGVADETLFRDIRAFMDRHDAPELAREAIAFRYALATWDFQEMSRAADAMLPSLLDRDGWMLPEEVLAGGIVAKLRLGDVQGAVSLWEELGPLAQRGGFDLRMELLRRYLDVFEANQGS
jgi:hypothetical protein